MSREIPYNCQLLTSLSFFALQHCASAGRPDTLLYVCATPLGLWATVEPRGGPPCGHLQATLVAQPALHSQLLRVQRDVPDAHTPSGHRHGTICRGTHFHIGTLALATPWSLCPAAALHSGHSSALLHNHCESVVQLHLLWHQVCSVAHPSLYDSTNPCLSLSAFSACSALPTTCTRSHHTAPRCTSWASCWAMRCASTRVPS